MKKINLLYKRIITLCLITFIFSIHVKSVLSDAKGSSTEKTVKLSRWEDQRRVDDFCVYSLLIKSEGAGNFLPEPLQWEMKGTLKDPEREPALRTILTKYPNSEYADDAALLLARARLFYHNDAAGSIKELYKVISDYPDGNWIAEDGIWLQIVPAIARIDKNGQRVPREPLKERPRGLSGEMFAYLEYLEKEPHKTVDEAKYWIAKIILSTDLKKSRYEEAIKNLKDIIEKYKDPKFSRRKKDLSVIGNIKDWPFPALMRIEQKCQHLLIKVYYDKKEYTNAAITAEDYLSVYEGHPACKEVYMITGQAYEALQQWDKATYHYEKFLSYPKIAEQTRIKYEQKLNQIKNKKS